MKYIVNIAVILVSCLLVSCGGKKEETKSVVTFDQAMDSYQSGNYKEAAEMCDALVQQGDTARMTWRQYCTMATIYALAYDNDYNTEASMASAMQYLARAVAAQPDSVAEYATLLPVDEGSAFNTAYQALISLAVDDSVLGDHEEDEAEYETHQH